MKKDIVTYDDFAKLDIRTGKIIAVEPVSGSEKLLQLTVDFGLDYGERTILSGIAKFYTVDDLLGKVFLFLANLQPRPMMGIESQGMILAVDAAEKPILLKQDDDLAVGTPVC